MEKLRRWGEPIFWLVVLLGTLPAILSNSVIPWNWYLPWTVVSVDPMMLGGLVWLGLFILAVAFAVLRRSILRVLATLPLLALWYMPVDRIDIDLSHPRDQIYFQARFDNLKNSDGSAFIDDLSRLQNPDIGAAAVSFYQNFADIAAAYPDRFADDPDMAKMIYGRDLFADYVMSGHLEVPTGRDVWTDMKVFISDDPFPSAELMQKIATIPMATPDVLLNPFLPADLGERRSWMSEQLATISGQGAIPAILFIWNLLREAETEVWSMILSLISLMALVIFSVIGGMRVMSAAMLLLISAAYSLSYWTPLAAFSGLQVFLLICLLIFGTGFLRSNAGYLKTLGRRKNLSNLWRTFVPWSLFLILFAGTIIVSTKVTNLVTEQVYNIGYPQSLAPEDRLFNVEKSGEGLEADLRNAAADHYAYLNNATSSAAITFRDNYNRDSTTAVNDTMASIENAVAPVIFGPNDFDHCLEPPDLLCPLANEIRRAINRSYRKARERQMARLHDELTDLSLQGKDAVNSGVAELNTKVALATEEASQWTVKGISGLFLWYHVATTLSIIFLIFVLIKSFLFIASRVYLHADDGNQEVWEELSRPHGDGVPVSREKTYVFDRDRWGTFFVRRGQSNKNIKRDISWPQWNRMIFRRLASRMFALYREDWSRDHGEKFVKTTKGGEFVEWQLAAGQRVVIQIRNLAAFSETVKLRSLWSFRLSHFIFGRVLFSSIEGPGMILLRTNGEPHIGTEGDRFILGAAPNEHIAFDLATDFLVNSDLKLKNMYFSDIEVVANDSPRVVVDVMPEHSFTGGAARFIRAFFIPV